MDPEIILSRQAVAGDVRAFTELVRMHEGQVRRFLGRLTGEGADDLAQEVFVKAWRSAGHWHGKGAYKSWLLGIAWNEFLVARRSAKRRTERESAFEGRQLPGDANEKIDVARALAALGERERAAALLCFAEGYSHVEAATIMRIPLGTLKSALARARTALAARLEMSHD
jgi:RNA polymerase sigma-70 factor (ECF subfamily)